MATTPKGLFYPDETTNITPLHTVLGAMQTSTDNLLTGRGTAFATTGDRDTAIPAPSAGMFVSTGTGSSQVWWLHNGSTWVNTKTIPNQYASTAARDAAIPSPSAGMIVTTGTGSSQILWVYSGSAWVNTYTLPTWYADTTARDAAITSPAAGMIAATGTGTGYVLWNYTGSAWARVTPEEAAPMPRSRGVITTTFSVPTGAYARISGFSEEYDVGSMFDPTTGFVTIPADGGYVVNAGLAFAANATGRKFAQIEKGTGAAGTNTNLIRAEVANTPNGDPSCIMSLERGFSAGDVLALCAYQTSGAALNLRGDLWPVYLSVRRVW